MGEHRYSRFVLAAALAVALPVGLVGCGDDPDDSIAAGADGGGESANRQSNKIVGSVGEWFVRVDATSAEAGEVIFAIANFGSIDHEFLVTKTSYEPGKIPIGENNRFDEEDPGIEVIDEIKEWPINEAKVLKLDLEPGTYELLCNIEAHYGNGMHTTLIVED